MDRELSAATKQAHKRRRLWQIGAAVVFVAAAIFGFRNFISPGIDRSEIRTATVEHGPVVATLTATGVVVPELEQAITSPIQARIEQVVRTSGEEVKPGDQVLLLDRSFTQLAYDKLKDEQEMPSLVILIDEQQMEQVILNILKNAMEAIGEEGEISIRTQHAPPQLTITDNGEGIPEEVKQHLFTPFYTTKNNGQGIGLTMVRDILVHHGFTFTLNSDKGLTSFTINLQPLA